MKCYVALARLYTSQKNYVVAEQLLDKVLTKWDSIIDPMVIAALNSIIVNY